jgi:RIO kinase 1
MRTPDTLLSLVDYGIIDEVVRPLMSGKEAQIYLVLSGGEERVAKIYKEAQNRSFQNRADYTEGRRVRNSRDQRAMGNRSKHGRAQNEAAWKSAEVDMIYRLRDAGVRVPTPYHFIDGVLLMELVTDADGNPAPRLGDLSFEPEEATAIFTQLLGEVVRMLCAGVVHGDLSDFNVLMGASGPVVIDFPQAVDASSNQNARKLLLRDVDNLHRFHSKFAPGVSPRPYAQEMWDLYQRSALTPDTRLSGTFRAAERAVKADAVLDLIADAERDERRRRERLGLSLRGVEGAPEFSRRGPRPAMTVEPRPAPRRDEPARQETRGQERAGSDQRGRDQRNQSAPSRDPQRAPDREKRAPSREQRPPDREQRAPSRDERAPAREQRAPSREQRPPDREQRPPDREQRAPTREQRAPAREQRAPAREQRAPTRDERPSFRDPHGASREQRAEPPRGRDPRDRPAQTRDLSPPPRDQNGAFRDQRAEHPRLDDRRGEREQRGEEPRFRQRGAQEARPNAQLGEGWKRYASGPRPEPEIQKKRS